MRRCAGRRRSYVAISQIASAYYFAHFLIILPLISKFERPLPLPNSISASVLHGEKQEARRIGLADERARGRRIRGRQATWSASSLFSSALGFAGVLLISLVVGAGRAISSEPPEATAEHEFHQHPKQLALASDGPFGKFDRQQLQRGFQVYKEVCAACHGLSLVAFRDLHALGYEEAEVKAIANQWAIEVPSINPDTGEAATRKAIPSDRFPSPYANETAARAANNNALPPDLSLITKARHGGAAYIYSLLTGYQRAAGRSCSRSSRPRRRRPGLHYNPYFANLNIAMPPPLTSDGQVTYADGNRSRRSTRWPRTSPPSWCGPPSRSSRTATAPGLAVVDLPAGRDGPRLSRLSEHLGRGEAQGRADRRARPGEPGQEPPRQGARRASPAKP